MAEGTKKAGSIPFAYTIEALIKLKVLRVFVHPILDHTHDHLQTQTDGSPSGSPSSMVGPSLQGAEVSLVERGGATVIEVSSQVDSCEKQHLEIPLPDEVAVDGQSLSVIQRPDHLELKLRIVASLGEGNWGTQSSSSTELETIHGKGYFACGGCGQPVVEQGIKHFFPMPSENWEELADHWFDLQCGCGGPVKASLLARKVQARLVPTRATCLIGGTSYLLHEDDLAASGEGEESERGLWSERFLEKDPPVERERALTVSSEGGSTDGASLSNGDPKARGVLEQQWQSGTQTTDEQLGSNAGTARTSFGRPGSVSNDETNNRDEHWEPDAAQIGPTNEFERCRLQERLDEESSSGERGEASGASSAPCCGNVDSAADVAVELGPERIRELAEGPIEPTEPLSGPRKWVRFRCPCCAETLGVRRSTEDQQTTASSPGVYLFKHRVVLCEEVPTPPRREATREALLAHLSARLQQAAEQSLCSHFLLQGLLTGKPYCQITVLSRETFVWSGRLEGTGGNSGRSQGLKVLLTYPDEAEAGTAADTKRNNQVERVFLLEDDAEEVLRVLVANNEKYPLSCRRFKGASLSFL